MKFLMIIISCCGWLCACDNLLERELSQLAETYTNPFITNGYNESDLYKAVNYIKSQNIVFRAYLLKKNEEEKSIEMTSVGNGCDAIHFERANQFKNILEKTQLTKIKPFLLMADELYHSTSNLSEDQQNHIQSFFKKIPLFGFCTHPYVPCSKNMVLIPDPYLLDRMADIECFSNGQKVELTKKENKIFFRGAMTGFPCPFDLKNLDKLPRANILTMIDRMPYVDFRYSLSESVKGRSTEEFKYWFYESKKKLGADQFADWETHSQYKYLLSFDGFGAAWSRPILIMSVSSVLLMQFNCLQYFSPLLKEGVHYLRVKDDLSNLSELYHYLESNPAEAQKIVDEASMFVKKYMTKDAIYFYMKKAFECVLGSTEEQKIVDMNLRDKENIFTQNCHVLVPSCDKYSDLWEPFFSYLFKYHPQLKQSLSEAKISLISNHKVFENDRVSNFRIVDEISWSNNVVRFLEIINQDYVLLYLEDYFLRWPVDHNKLMDVFAYMHHAQVEYVEIASDTVEFSNSKIYSPSLGLYEKNIDSGYPNSLQACIWKKETLLSLLKNQNFNPWQFETIGREWRRSNPNLTYLIVDPEKPIVSYYNVYDKGQIRQATKLLWPEIITNEDGSSLKDLIWYFDLGPR